MTDTPKRAAIYARSATSQENGHSFALDSQVFQGREYCSQKGYSLLYVYAETGSAYSIDRNALLTALEDAKAGKFDVLVIHDFFRLARKGERLAMLISQFEEAGVTIESVTEQEDLDALIPVLFEEVREMQRERMSLRIRAGQKSN